eukprot:GHVU01224963.1.p1 GENE.GHVU01224963.1~~GHVU01224963.1.p1  ORF type:complete len:153 (-),score=3.84 GHVU01224963.1:19-477(-)
MHVYYYVHLRAAVYPIPMTMQAYTRAKLQELLQSSNEYASAPIGLRVTDGTALAGSGSSCPWLPVVLGRSLCFVSTRFLCYLREARMRIQKQYQYQILHEYRASQIAALAHVPIGLVGLGERLCRLRYQDRKQENERQDIVRGTWILRCGAV